MKKFLFFASAALFMASCTQDELESINVAEQNAQGITFAVEENVGSRAQWEYVDGGLGMFWYAEQDRMDFYGKNVESNGTAYGKDWDLASKLTYKATRSENKGYFTAIGDQLFAPVKDEDDKWVAPTFAYVWPTGTTVKVESGKLVATLPALNTQNQDKVNGSSTLANVFMAGTKTASTAAFDEEYTTGSDMLVGISLERVMPLLGFYVKGYDKATFGELKSVTLTSDGKLGEDNKPVKVDGVVVKSTLDYGTDAKWNIDTKTYTVGNTSTASSVKVTVNGTSGLEWGNGKDYTVYMTVAPVDRSKMEYGEKMTVSYEFANITINREIVMDQTWETGHHYYANRLSGTDGYDLISEPYLVFNNGTLQLNPSFTGNLSAIVENGKIKKYETELAEINRIVSYVDLNDADFTYIGENAKALTALVLKEDTSIPAFDSKATSELTYLEAPKVSTIAQGAFKKNDAMFVNLQHCLLGSYKYNDAIVANQLLTESLVTVDLSSVEVIAPEFPAVGISMQGFAKLTTVTLMDGVKLGTKAYYDCAKLATIKYAGGVTGSVDLVGTYAFAGSTTANATKIKSIAVKGTVIPQGSFSNCASLATIKGNNQKAIVPTEIGSYAFEATPITTIDLSAATKIGKAAFMKCVKLEGDLYPASGVKALFVSEVTEVAESLFEGCTSLKYVSFPKATKVNNNFLKGVTCNEIKFVEEIAFAGASDATMTEESFGTTTNTVLFINGAQAGVSGTKLTLGKQTFTFKNIK